MKPLNFWSKVWKTTNCWLWLGGCNDEGYGYVTVDGKMIGAHRYSLILSGIDPTGLDVLHNCDNPKCVRPDHLFLGNDKINYEDARSKGRHSHGEKHGCAVLTTEVVRTIRHKLRHGERVTDLAKEYRVSKNTISKIWHNKIWVGVQ